MHELRRKLERLSEMSRTEVDYRLREKARREWDRLKFHLDSRKPELPDNISAEQYLNRCLGKRFYIPGGRSTRDQTRRWIGRNRLEWMTRSIEEGERLIRHYVPILGHGEVALGSKIDWHRDPVSGRTWKRRFWADYKLDRDCSGGDAKTIHELNRHQHLPRLAKAYYLTGDERFAREALSQMESWIEQNPRWFGVNWRSSLDIAIRSISWLWTLFFLLPSPALDGSLCRHVLTSLFEQLNHIHRYPSLFSSPNTHLIGEAAALFIAGLVFEGAPHSQAWLARGRDLLVETMDRQVSKKGVHTELSPYYHAYALDFYLQAWILARKNGARLPVWTWDRLRLMLEFIRDVARPGGTLPLMGDDDGGRALALYKEHYGSFEDGLCTGALLFAKPDFKGQTQDFHEETLWLLGTEGANTFARLRSTQPKIRDAFYAEAGYFIQRTGWTRRDSQLIFDCGGLGSLGGVHGHADALSVTLFAGGREVLMDPGTFVYNCAPQWRNFFRCTAAHNTVLVDGQDQSVPAGTFRWGVRARAGCVKNASLPEVSLVEGEHDGYSRLTGSVIHRRRVIHIRPDYWLVFDDFRGEGEHEFDLFYHFSPECEIEFTAPALKTSELLLYVCGSRPVESELILGQDTPPQGWVSRRYGQKTPAPVLRAHLRSSVPAGFLSVLFPLSADVPIIGPLEVAPALWAGGPAESGPSAHRAAPATALSIEYDTFRDFAILVPTGQEIRTGEFSAQGELFWLRTINGAPKRLLGVNTRSFRQNSTTLFEETEPVSCVFLRFGEDPRVTRERVRGENVCVESAVS